MAVRLVALRMATTGGVLEIYSIRELPTEVPVELPDAAIWYLCVTGVLENHLRGCSRVFTSVATMWQVTGF